MNQGLVIVAAGLLAVVAACAPDAGAPPEAIPSFERDIAPVLEARCTASRGCHGAEPTAEVDLDLRRTRAYWQLVAVPAETGRGALLRVEPGHPATSVLVQKLTGRGGPGAGRPMPLDPRTGGPAVPSPLAPAWTEAVLVPWIAAGAPNN